MAVTPGDWEDLWKTQEPGMRWDKGESAPILGTLPVSEALPDGNALRGFVPGCGRGYDVEVLATHTRFAHVTGLEVSPTAVAAARSYLRGRGVDADKFAIDDGDFFDTGVAPGPFDVAFDYTFFCAMQLARRADWARAYAARLRAGGVLATLMYPVGKDPALGGPPFSVTPEAYAAVLEPAGFECVVGPRVLQEDEAAQGRAGGKSIWAIWRRL